MKQCSKTNISVYDACTHDGDVPRHKKTSLRQMWQHHDKTKADKLEHIQPCLFICHIYVLVAAPMFSLENHESFLKVDESAMGKEFDLTMMLIAVVSGVPNDVSGATHGA